MQKQYTTHFFTLLYIKSFKPKISGRNFQEKDQVSLNKLNVQYSFISVFFKLFALLFTFSEQ